MNEVRHLAFENTNETFTDQFVHKKVKRTKYKKKTHWKRIDMRVNLTLFLLFPSIRLSISLLLPLLTATIDHPQYSLHTIIRRLLLLLHVVSHVTTATSYILQRGGYYVFPKNKTKVLNRNQRFRSPRRVTLNGGSSTLQWGSNAWICSFSANHSMSNRWLFIDFRKGKWV